MGRFFGFYSFLIIAVVFVGLTSSASVPSKNPTVSPTTKSPSLTPSKPITTVPSAAKTSAKPSSQFPTGKPTAVPTGKPISSIPSTKTTSIPTAKPSSNIPTAKPTSSSKSPSSKPSSISPTFIPTKLAASTPTTKPTSSPTAKPSSSVPSSPSAKSTTTKPTAKPSSRMPTAVPSIVHSETSSPTVTVLKLFNTFTARHNVRFFNNSHREDAFETFAGNLKVASVLSNDDFKCGITKFAHLTTDQYRSATGIDTFGSFLQQLKNPTTKSTRKPSQKPVKSSATPTLKPGKYPSLTPSKTPSRSPSKRPAVASVQGSTKSPKPPTSFYKFDDGRVFTFTDDYNYGTPNSEPASEPSSESYYTPFADPIAEPNTEPNSEPSNETPNAEPTSEPVRKPPTPYPVKPTVTSAAPVKPTVTTGAPVISGTSRDWTSPTALPTGSAVTPIKDQGQCGSCWAFASVGAIESAYAIKNGQLISFSEQQLVSCDKAEGGCNGGWPSDAMLWVGTTGGLPTEVNYPYTATDSTCKTNIVKDPKTMVSKSIEVPNNFAAMKAALDIGPVTVTVAASSSVWQLYTKGVLSSSACGKVTDHAILAVGYGVDAATGKSFIKCKNSWGNSWGENGYVRIWADDTANTCAIYSNSYYPVLK
mmetsp:Transcript_13455/g.18420  ORF Transcript_13455/g.18420 Transcript_13455/m.18420 type:complete len:646 (+) Transcript_13455:24-1961(+)